jgi:hypothetical protein
VIHKHPQLAGWTYEFNWNSSLAQRLLRKNNPKLTDDELRNRNYAVTLPSLTRRRHLVIHVAWDWISARHAAHEICGHGKQVHAMGTVDYLATYTWHFILRSGSHAKHMMEIDARKSEVFASLFELLYTRGMESDGYVHTLA